MAVGLHVLIIPPKLGLPVAPMARHRHIILAERLHQLPALAAASGNLKRANCSTYG